MNELATSCREPAEANSASSIVNIAAYKFVAVSDLTELRAGLKKLCSELRLKGTILISPEGINMFLAGKRDPVDRFLSELRADSRLANIEAKESLSEEQPFKRMLVKIKREIIAFGVESVAPALHTSPKLPAKKLREWLDEGRPLRLLDTRNDYEVDLGTFEGAERLGIQHFRQFPEAVSQLPETAKNEPVVMFCTGGIRCEKAGPLMEQLGFREIYQLEGGILKYFEECGGAHYNGDCFVFDGRVALNPQLEPTGVIQCFNCQAALDHDAIQSEKFSFGVSCPHCYQTSDEQRERQKARHQAKVVKLAESQPGSAPYDNERLIFVPGRLAGVTLIDFLCSYHPPTAREQWLAWINEGTLTSHRLPVTSDQIVREGQQFEQVMRNFVEPRVATDIKIVFEDEALVVVDKPAPLPVHPSGRFNRNTLLSLLSEAYRPEKLRIAHRLDANTTGLVVLCRKFSAARTVQPQFSRQEVDKRYLLRVQGSPESDEFGCDAPIGNTSNEVGARTTCPDGQAASTTFRVLSRYDDGTSLLEATPQTGRTNQIRIHAWHLGFPIIGDPLYLPNGELGSKQTLALDDQPMCLHARSLSFKHPFTGETVCFEATPPEWAQR